MDACIKEMKCIRLNKDPTTKIRNKTIDLVKTGEWPEEMKSLARVNYLGTAPRLVGKLKDHKLTLPLRPIVSKCIAVTCFLEKAMANILRQFLPPSIHSLHSTMDFISRIKAHQFTHPSIIASLDIVSLFPSIDLDRIRETINSKVNQATHLSSGNKDTLIRTLNLILQSNYFVFNGNYYNQTDGAPMGSSISSILAEFLLRPLETNIHNTFALVPDFWVRYVDDIFIIWQHSLIDLHSFVDQINTLDDKLKFTLEIESNNQLPFLDVLVIKNDSQLQFTVYRKPKANQSVIPANAHSPHNYKFAAFRSFINRAFTICSEEHLAQELACIRRIGYTNGYSIQRINQLILKKIRSLQDIPLNINPRSTLPFCSMDYYPGLFEKLHNKLQNLALNLVARSPLRLIQIIDRKIDPPFPDDLPGVYEIPYLNSEGKKRYYIGMTGRKFTDRKKEHISDIKHGRLKTALARTALTQQIQILFNESKIIKLVSNRTLSLINETIEIYSRKDELCNDFPSFQLANIWKEMIGHYTPTVEVSDDMTSDNDPG